MATSEPLAYYIQWDCPNEECEETNYLGVNLSFITHGGLPVILYDDGACQAYTCTHCGRESYTGDLELMSDDE